MQSSYSNKFNMFVLCFLLIYIIVALNNWRVFYNYTSLIITLIIDIYLNDETKVVINNNKIKNDKIDFDNKLKDFI